MRRMYSFLSLVLAVPVLGNPSPNRQTPMVKAIQRGKPAVVNIHSQKSANIDPSRPNFGAPAPKMNGMGTGVILDERGYVITNYHVIEDVTSINVTLVDGATYSAEVVGRDPETDLALLKINPRQMLQVMPLGASDDLMHGETVIAIGNAFGYEHTITSGIISQLHRDVRLSADQAYKDLIQTDASINPGNSGGPLLNLDGEMIGLNVAIRAGAQGIGFAIPVDEVKRVAAKLMSARQLANLWHGMVCQPVLPDAGGMGRVMVKAVEPGSPAQSAGIRPGDRVLSIANRSLSYPHDVERAIIGRRPHEELNVVLARGSREEHVKLVLQQSKAEQEDGIELVWRRLGLRLAETTSMEGRRAPASVRGGVKVLHVADQSSAQRAGILSGDVLVGLHQWETLSVENIVYVITRQLHDESSPVRFYVLRGGQIHRGYIDIPKEG